MATTAVGRVESLWRYPVRSMRGERVPRTAVSKLGIAGDRAWSVVDPADGRIATAAKRPRDWASLLEFDARYLQEPGSNDARAPAVELLHQSGARLNSEDAGVEDRLSELLQREARLHAGDSRGALSAAAVAREDASAPEPPYASAPIHLLTTSSLRAAEKLHPQGRFELVRFRPNVVVDTGDAPEFLEASWVGGVLRIGDTVAFHVFKECDRCVLTTLPQAGLPKDPAILATAVQHNRTFLGISCSVPEAGTLREGDPVLFDPA